MRRIVVLSLIGAVLVLVPILYFTWLWNSQAEEAELSALPPLLAELRKKYGPNHYSQWNEELIIRDFFADRRDGFFIDVGAYHYKDKSNTYYLEKELGWSGIAIEPQTKFREDYLHYRPKTTFYPFFVSDVSDENVTLVVPKGRDNRASADNRVRDHYPDAEKQDVPTITLDDLLEKAGITKIDFLTMDIQYWEPKALAGFSIEKYRPELVCIEAHSAVRDEIVAYFARHGYVRIDKYLEVDSTNYYYTPAATAGGSSVH